MHATVAFISPRAKANIDLTFIAETFPEEAGLTNIDPVTSSGSAAQDVLRRLALKAAGLTGADVAGLVREARQKARREIRSVTFADLLSIVDAAKPEKSEELRRRMAIHEAGHAVVGLALAVGTIKFITIDGVGGNGYIDITIPNPQVEIEARFADLLVYRLAGRAAEKVLLGSVVAGSGGTPESDLAKATGLATAMETALGFAADRPLLYRSPDEHSSALTYNPMLAEQVNARLEAAYDRAQEIVQKSCKALNVLATALMKHGTLEGTELSEVIATMRITRPLEEAKQVS